MPRKYLILVCALLSLILSEGANAETEREAIINHTQNATWAYHTENDFIAPDYERWYISLIRTTTASNVYSLGPINNGQAAWWSVGTDVATFNPAISNVSFAQYLDNSASDTFWDEGLKQYVTNSLIHSDRQKLQGKTVRIKWYFFHAPNGSWYIVNAPGYGTALDVRRFAEKNGQYDWPAVDVSGVNATFTPSQSGNGVTISFATDTGVSSFQWPIPIPSGSTIDSPATSIYSYGAGFEYLGPTAGDYIKCGDPSLYEPNADVNFHPGIDINVLGTTGNEDMVMGTPIYSIANGTVRDIYLGDGSIVIEHPVGNGSSVWANYRHNSDISVSVGTTVVKGQPIAKMGNVINAGAIYAHLHFEIRKPEHPERASASSWCVYGGKSSAEPNNWLYDPLIFLRNHK